MTRAHSVVPWTCHLCGRSFAETRPSPFCVFDEVDAPRGGLCSDCGRVTCPACFPLSETIRKAGARRCRACLAARRATQEGQDP
jgi:hypothetical protein